MFRQATPLDFVLEELYTTPVTNEIRTTYKPSPYFYRTSNGGATPDRLLKIAKMDPLASAQWDGKLADPNVDYLANQGVALEEACNADPATKARLRDALELFIGAEAESRRKIEDAISESKIQIERSY